MTTDITEMAQRARINAECGEHLSPAETMELVEALERAHQTEKTLKSRNRRLDGIISAAEKRVADLESRLGSADKLQDSAFRSGLQHGFSLGQTDDQKGYEQSIAAYSPAAGIKWEAE